MAFGRYTLLVGTSHNMARTIEFGGVVSPTSASMLVWDHEGGQGVAHATTMPARPFLRPAADEMRGKAYQTALRRGRSVFRRD